MNDLQNISHGCPEVAEELNNFDVQLGGTQS